MAKDNNGGRPTLCTPEVIKKIEQAILAGAYPHIAAAYAGISRDSFYEYLKRGAKARKLREAGKEVDPEEEVFLQFSDNIEKAMIEAELRDVIRVDHAADKNWQAAAWKLERQHPDRYGRKERHELVGEGGGPVDVNVSSAKERLAARLAVMSKRSEADQINK